MSPLSLEKLGAAIIVILFTFLKFVFELVINWNIAQIYSSNQDILFLLAIKPPLQLQLMASVCGGISFHP